MKNSSLLTIIFSILVGLKVLGQNNPGPIQPDRPGLGESSQIVPEKYFQVESGMNLEFDKLGDINYRNVSWNNFTLRWGIFNEFELRFAFNLQQDYVFTSLGRSVSSLGMTPATIGFKARVTHQKGVIPSTALLGNLGLPKLGTPELSTSYVSPSILMPMEWEIKERFLITLNNGLFWNGEDALPEYFSSLGLDVAMANETGLFVEGYLSTTDGKDIAPGLNAGFIWRIKTNFQIDISAGMGLNHNIADGFVNAGFSWRLPKFQK